MELDFKKILTASVFACAATGAFAAPTVYEAEAQSGVDVASIKEDASYSGGKYVAVSAAMDFKVKVEETAMYDIETRVLIKQYDWTTSKIVVNGVEAGSMLTTPRNNDSTYVVRTSAKMKAGENTITVGNGAIGVDYVSVERHPSTVYNLDANPVTPGATESAYKLKAFLTENFGKRTVSGMMIGDNAFNYHYGATLEDSYLITACTPADSCEKADSLTTWKGQEDIHLFKERSGHYPALGGFDFLFATGGHSDEGWFSGYTDNSVRMAKELWNAGGIPAFDWHWKVGTDTVFYSKTNGYHNAACTEGVADSDPNNTCFNYTKAFKDSTCKEIDETSATYKLMMADVDKISARFLDLQKDSVAAIWRPLHEAAGGWFWWGIAGGACYKALYKMVFDRMVNVNGVKNAIWVWNLERNPDIGYDENAYDSTWYPGAEYVDVFAVDIYNNANDHSSNAKYYNKIVELMGADKIIGLSENGPIPDIDSTFEDESVWSWWMPWYETWSSGFLSQTSAAILKKNLDDERVIALDNMPGWANVTTGISKRGIANENASITNNINITVSNRTLNLYLPQSGRGSVTLFDMQGHKIATLAYGNLTAGTQSYDLQSLASGSYLTRATVNSKSKTTRIILK